MKEFGNGEAPNVKVSSFYGKYNGFFQYQSTYLVFVQFKISHKTTAEKRDNIMLFRTQSFMQPTAHPNQDLPM